MIVVCLALGFGCIVGSNSQYGGTNIDTGMVMMGLGFWLVAGVMIILAIADIARK